MTANLPARARTLKEAYQESTPVTRLSVSLLVSADSIAPKREIGCGGMPP